MCFATSDPLPPPVILTPTDYDALMDNPPKTDHMIAKCGHHDLLGYFTGTVCLACARAGHREALGKNPRPRKRKTRG